MDIYEIINHRQSDRQYDPERPVEPEKIRRILEAARIAPSACNAQPWHFIVVNPSCETKWPMPWPAAYWA